MAGMNRVERLASELERVWCFAEHLRPANKKRLVAMEQFDIPSLSAVSYWEEVADRLAIRVAPKEANPKQSASGREIAAQ